MHALPVCGNGNSCCRRAATRPSRPIRQLSCCWWLERPLWKDFCDSDAAALTDRFPPDAIEQILNGGEYLAVLPAGPKTWRVWRTGEKSCPSKPYLPFVPHARLGTRGALSARCLVLVGGDRLVSFAWPVQVSQACRRERHFLDFASLVA